MVKIILDKRVDLWVYIPECPCNNAFFTQFNFDQLNMIVRLTKLVIYNSYIHNASPYELLSEAFGEYVSLYSGAIENDNYLKATTHEVGCIDTVQKLDMHSLKEDSSEQQSIKGDSTNG